MQAHLDTELAKRNPGAVAVLTEYGLDPVDAAYRLSNVVPSVISIEFNGSASKHHLAATMAELLETMRAAAPATIEVSKEEWLARRSATTAGQPQHQRAGGPALSDVSGGGGGNGSGGRAILPPQLPQLPSGFMARTAVLDAVKEAMAKFGEAGQEGHTRTVCMRGMGGSGKTVAAVSLAKDTEVRSRFEA